MPVLESLSTVDVAYITGLSPTRIDRYARLGVFGEPNRSPGSGRRRGYEWGDVLVARVLRTLMGLRFVFCGGVPEQLAVAVASAMRGSDGDYLCIDGQRVTVTDNPCLDGAVVVVSLLEARQCVERARPEFEL